MKTFNKIKLVTIIIIFCTVIFSFPENLMAQRFGHGGGGGGGSRGGGGGGAARGGFNGGSRNAGNHVFRAPEPTRSVGGGGRGDDRRGWGGGVIRNENVYHNGGRDGFGYGSRPYYYHPYHPYVWGRFWHPFGFFAATLTADAIMFNWNNQQYYYDEGVYYQPSGNGYAVVAPPVGAVVSYLPTGYITVMVGDDTYYYYGGAFYISQGGSFRVVPAPPGAVVYEIPEGATDQVINGVDYILYNNTYYEPISQNGQDAYEVVQVN